MSFKSVHSCGLVLAILLATLLVTPAAAAATPPAETPAVMLKVTPDKCISLQQGRACYSKVTAQWHSSQPLDLCLKLDDAELHCWHQQQAGSYVFEFAGAQASSVQLWQQQQVVAQSRIEVKWVHTASKTKRHWRLF